MPNKKKHMFRPKFYPKPKTIPEQRSACSVHFPSMSASKVQIYGMNMKSKWRWIHCCYVIAAHFWKVKWCFVYRNKVNLGIFDELKVLMLAFNQIYQYIKYQTQPYCPMKSISSLFSAAEVGCLKGWWCWSNFCFQSLNYVNFRLIIKVCGWLT